MKTPFPQTNRRILIIDDTPAIHADFRKILTPDTSGEADLNSLEQTLFGTRQAPHLAFQVDSAYQGQEALKLVQLALAGLTRSRSPTCACRPVGMVWRPSKDSGKPIRTCKSRYAPPTPTTAGKPWPNGWSSAISY